MNLPHIPGVRRVSPADFACDPGRKESGVRKRFRFVEALFTLAVFMAGGNAASAATIANHMDYPVEGFSLWCQDPQQHWIERKLTGHLDMEQQAAITLPEDPCFFLEADMGDYLLSFPIKQELQPDDLLDTSCMPDPTLEVYRKAEPLFIADGEEKDRGLERDPDRNPPETVSIGRLLDTFKGGMSEQECLMYGIPLRRESYNDSQNVSIKTALVSDGVVWHGVISLYKDAETNMIGLSLATSLSEGSLEKLFSALSERAYKHAALGDDGPVYMDDPILSPDPAVRKEAIRNMLAQLAAPNADPYDTHFEPDSPECREKDAKEEKKTPDGAQSVCKELSADIRIAPGSDRIELFLQEGEESAE